MPIRSEGCGCIIGAKISLTMILLTRPCASGGKSGSLFAPPCIPGPPGNPGGKSPDIMTGMPLTTGGPEFATFTSLVPFFPFPATAFVPFAVGTFVPEFVPGGTVATMAFVELAVGLFVATVFVAAAAEASAPEALVPVFAEAVLVLVLFVPAGVLFDAVLAGPLVLPTL